MNNAVDIWKGVYKSFSEVVSEEDKHAFNSSAWFEQLFVKLQDKINSDVVLSYDYPLSIAISMDIYNRDKKDNYCILDFGGGLGANYFLLRKSLNAEVNLKYDIVELEDVVGFANKKIKNNELSFYNSLPEKTYFYDCVHCGSSLQYIEDWQDIINKLTSYKPKMIVFSDMTVGKFKSFVSTQKYYNKTIPVKFYNEEDFIAIMANMGFKSIYSSYYCAKVLGEFGPLPMHGLPEENRINHTKNYIFLAC